MNQAARGTRYQLYWGGWLEYTVSLCPQFPPKLHWFTWSQTAGLLQRNKLSMAEEETWVSEGQTTAKNKKEKGLATGSLRLSYPETEVPRTPLLWLTSLSKTLFLSCPTPAPLRTEEHQRKSGMKPGRTLGGLSGYKPLSVPHFLFDLPQVPKSKLWQLMIRTVGSQDSEFFLKGYRQ